MRHRLVAAALSLALAGGAVGVTGCSATTPKEGPNPYDVAAARACAALQRYVNDIKDRQPKQADSTAFDEALQQLTTGHSPGSRWSALVSDLNNFVTDGEAENLTNLNADGLAAGQQCATIPPAAKAAGGFS